MSLRTKLTNSADPAKDGEMQFITPFAIRTIDGFVIKDENDVLCTEDSAQLLDAFWFHDRISAEEALGFFGGELVEISYSTPII
jgi:hypothetical protein